MMATFTSRSPVVVGILSVFSVGCTGSIVGMEGDFDPGDDPDPGDTIRGQGGADGVPGVNQPTECPPAGAPTVGAAPLRRLTRAEYNNSVRDLLGDDSRPADGFPPEPAVHGFDNNASTQTVGFALADDLFRTAERLATAAVAKLPQLSPCNLASLGEEACARAFISKFGMRVYRRPITGAEESSLLSTYQKGRQTGEYSNGIRLVLMRMLSSPHFLYRPEFGDKENRIADGVIALTSWETATRLSFALWGSTPDQELLDQAAAGALSTEDEVAAQAVRMLADERARENVQRFYSSWLLLDELQRATKDEVLYPGFGAVMPAMKEEIVRLIDDVLWTQQAAFSELFNTNYSFMNRKLATYLGIDDAAAMDDSFTRIDSWSNNLPQGAWRAGVLSTAGLLAAHSKPTETSPILRGRFVAEQILCLPVPPPPDNVEPLPEVDASGLTTRQRFEAHSKAACANCHKLMDPLGFAFENFDTVGRFRATEGGLPIDPSGTLVGTDVDGEFDGPVGLGQRLADSQQVRGCISLQWARFVLGREIESHDERSLLQVQCALNDKGAGIAQLAEGMFRSDSFRYFSREQGEQP